MPRRCSVRMRAQSRATSNALSTTKTQARFHLSATPTPSTSSVSLLLKPASAPSKRPLLAIEDPEPFTYFLREQNEGFGFGDIQVERVLSRLRASPMPPPQLGGYTPGVQGADIRWDEKTMKLVAI